MDPDADRKGARYDGIEKDRKFCRLVKLCFILEIADIASVLWPMPGMINE
jgi:hypothetical protein